MHDDLTQASPWFIPVAAVSGAAQNLPARPIKLIVPFPAGGPNDIIARVIGQRMSELSGQPVVIDNRGGQGEGDQDAGVETAK